MEQLPWWFNGAVAISGAIGTLVTAVATFFLWRVTKTLAAETTRMAEAAGQPHVVATLIPNRWSMRHFDLHVDNTGNATAYDIRIAFDPPLENGEARSEELGLPLQKISVLKPGQGLHSYLSEYEKLKGKVYRVAISWRRDPSSEKRQDNIYTLSMADNDGLTRLGDEPLVQIAKHVKKLDESWSPIAKGSKRTKVDVYSAIDRLRERREVNRQRRQWVQQQKSSQDGAATQTSIDVPPEQ